MPWGDLEALERELARADVAALVLEPVQGKGVNLPPDGYLQGAQTLCRQAGALFVCDEVQTGSGAPAGSWPASTGASSRT